MYAGLIKLDIYRSSNPSAGGIVFFCHCCFFYNFQFAALAAVRASINSFIDETIDEEAISSARCRYWHPIAVYSWPINILQLHL